MGTAIKKKKTFCELNVLFFFFSVKHLVFQELLTPNHAAAAAINEQRWHHYSYQNNQMYV